MAPQLLVEFVEFGAVAPGDVRRLRHVAMGDLHWPGRIENY